MNPCRCGKYLDDPTKCTCTPTMIRSYQGRISGALLDRMDIYSYSSKISEEALLDTIHGESGSESVIWRDRISELWDIQYERCDQMGIPRMKNGECQDASLGDLFRIGEKESQYAALSSHNLGLSVRGLKRLLRLSRTIADLDGSKDVKVDHITEALSFRLPNWSEKKS